MLRDGARVFAETSIESGLSTAGLLAGEVHADAKAVENVHDSFTSFREKGIDKTGNEELDYSHKSILIPNVKTRPTQ
jgi:hypothetical protein